MGQVAQRRGAVATIDVVPREQLLTPAALRPGPSEEPRGSLPCGEPCLGVSGWLEAHSPGSVETKGM